jgi:ABC-type transport system involved in multi-copper enzyme maturation permease subunit
MILPVAERELRSAARRPQTYYVRWGVAGSGFLLFAWIWLGMDGSTWFSGPRAFAMLCWIAWVFALFGGAIAATDAISSEKRENTLGLLFLTDLRGYDVVLGKLFSSSLNCFFGLMALVPVLAIPLVMGGVSFGQFGRVQLNLVNTLLFSVAVGLFSSAISKHPFRAATLGLAIVSLFGFGFPIVAQILRVKGYPVHVVEWVQIASPFFTQKEAGVLFGTPNYFWISSAAVFGLTLFWLTVTCVVVPRIWQERPAIGWMARVKSVWNRWHFGSAEQRRKYRRRLAEANPFYWLAAREQISSLGFILLAGAVIAAALAIGLSVGQSAVGSPQPLGGVVFVWMWAVFFLHAVMLYKVASAGCQRFGEDRASGALELLLVTPLKVGSILRGQWRALFRQMLAPAVVLFLVHGLLVWGALALFTLESSRYREMALLRAAVTGNAMGMQEPEIYFLIPLRLLLVSIFIVAASWIAIGWVSMWIGLRTNWLRFAPWMALGLVFVPPWPVFTFLVWWLEDLQSIWGEALFIAFLKLAIGLVLANLLLVSGWAWWKLRREFRRTVTDRSKAPLRLRLSLLMRRGAVVLGMISILVVTFYNVEAWRGKRAWNVVQEELDRSGESLDRGSLAQEKGSGKDLSSVPIFAPFFKYELDARGRVLWRGNDEVIRLNKLHLVELSKTKAGPWQLPPLSVWPIHGGADFHQWRDFITGETNSASSVTLSQAAAEVADAIDAFFPELEQLRELALEPELYFPDPPQQSLYSQGGFHGQFLSQVAQFLRLRAAARLAQGEITGAREDIEVLLGMASALLREPVFEAQAGAKLFISYALIPISKGLDEQSWTGPDLVAFQRRAGEFQMFEACERAMRIALIRQLTFLDALMEESAHDWREKQAMAKARLIYPSGWVYKRKAEFYRIYRESRDALVDPEARRFFPEKTTSAESSVPHFWSEMLISPGHFANKLEEMAREFARVQSGLFLAQISCALEQHRLVHGEYPETLESLTPEWIELVPHDPVNGDPFQYRRVSKDQFELYSVGWDRTDDGGDAGRDWVWSAISREEKPKAQNGAGAVLPEMEMGE